MLLGCEGSEMPPRWCLNWRHCHRYVIICCVPQVEKPVGTMLIPSMVRCGVADGNSFMKSSRIIQPVQMAALKSV